MAGFLTLRKTKKISGKSNGDGGTGAPGESGGGDGGTNASHGSTASNNKGNGSSGSSYGYEGGYDEDGDGLGVNGYSSSPSSITTGSYSDDDAADFSSPSSYDRASTTTNTTYGGGTNSVSSGISYSPIKTSYWDNDQAVDFSDPSTYDRASTTTDTTYGGGSTGLLDSIKSYVLENPLTSIGTVVGLLTSGPLGALGLGRLGSTADDVVSPTTSGLDKAVSVMSMAGMPGLMGLAAKGVVKGAEAIGATNPNPGVNPDVNTSGNRTAAESKLSYTAPKVEYKFDPFGDSGGLLQNGRISYSNLNKLASALRKQSGGLLDGIAQTRKNLFNS